MKLNKLKQEAINITKQIVKLGIIATLSTMANNVYRLQTNSTLQHISTDLKQISDSK